MVFISIPSLDTMYLSSVERGELLVITMTFDWKKKTMEKKYSAEIETLKLDP